MAGLIDALVNPCHIAVAVCQKGLLCLILLSGLMPITIFFHLEVMP